jgi:hypothetical protein
MAKKPQPSGHVHNYVTVRTAKTQDGTNRTMYFMECANPGCPKPNKVDVR